MSRLRTVYLVDDDREDRHHLAYRLGAAGIEAWPFGNYRAFLDRLTVLRPEVVLLGLEAPPHGGFRVLAQLVRAGLDWPLVAMSRGSDMQFAVEAMKLGAVDFLAKPVDEERLIASLTAASNLLDARLEAAALRRDAEERVACLTPRECDIALALLSGLQNKCVAHDLGISVRTVEAHRANLMMKLGVRSIAEVFALLARAGRAPHLGTDRCDRTPHAERILQRIAEGERRQRRQMRFSFSDAA